jgi:hypothetical protein
MCCKNEFSVINFIYSGRLFFSYIILLVEKWNEKIKKKKFQTSQIWVWHCIEPKYVESTFLSVLGSTVTYGLITTFDRTTFCLFGTIILKAIC